MKHVYASLAMIMLMLPAITKAQNIFPSNGSAGIGTTTPDGSAMLEMKSTTKGMLTPRMTKNQRDAIGSPATGLVIYQTNSIPGFYYYDGSGWKQMTPPSPNKSLSNLIGPTAVNVDLLPANAATSDLGSSVFTWKNAYLDGSIFFNGKRFIAHPGTYNTFVGEFSGLSDSVGFSNTGTGAYALYSNTTGNYNTASGYLSLSANTVGSQNAAFGSSALNANTDGNANTAIGYSALRVNTRGDINTALGAFSLDSNTTGRANTATGVWALHHNTEGYNNTATGVEAMVANTTGAYNSAFGETALYYNITGHDNTAVGAGASYSNTSGYGNTAVGEEALYNNTASGSTAVGAGALYYNEAGAFNTATGYQALLKNVSGIANTSVGYQALSNNTGSNNTGMGWLALFNNNKGTLNTSVGSNALSANTTGSENTAFGSLAGNANDANNYCSFFGYDANQSVSTNFTNSMALGNASRITASNQVRVGNSSITSIGGYANWSNISDGRFKKNLKQNVPGLAFINKLKPVTYNLDVSGLRQFMGEDASYDKDGKRLSSEADERTKMEIQKKEAMLQTGFVAQEVEKAAKELDYDFSGVDKPENENSPYGLRYSEFVVPLVKAVQELSKMNDQKDEIIETQNKKIDDLETRLAKLEAMMNSKQSVMSDELSVSDAKLSTVNGQLSSALSQNIPNPFNHTTTINYTLPQKFVNAQMVITDQTGKTIKVIKLSGSGNGTLTIDASLLAGGTYNYSLYVNGTLTGSKQMVLIK